LYQKTIEQFADLAKSKAQILRTNPIGFLIASAMAGAYVGIGILLIFSIGQTIDPSLRSLVMGASFGIALTLVVFAGSELFTGHTMFMTIGLMRGSVCMGDVRASWIVTWIGNLIGWPCLRGCSSSVGADRSSRRGGPHIQCRRGQDELTRARSRGSGYPVQLARVPRSVDQCTRYERFSQVHSDLLVSVRIHRLRVRAQRGQHDDLLGCVAWQSSSRRRQRRRHVPQSRLGHVGQRDCWSAVRGRRLLAGQCANRCGLAPEDHGMGQADPATGARRRGMTRHPFTTRRRGVQNATLLVARDRDER
jgi:hypothetical protein